MPTPGRDRARVAVRIDPDVWREEVERLDPGSRGRVAAERERPRLVGDGVDLTQLQRGAEVAEDRTRLPGLLKVYVPIGDGPPSERPFGMVFSPEPGPRLALVAFGERHPRTGTRTVYERAHKRLHGRYPGQ